jgi:hypothetical protein
MENPRRLPRSRALRARQRGRALAARAAGMLRKPPKGGARSVAGAALATAFDDFARPEIDRLGLRLETIDDRTGAIWPGENPDVSELRALSRRIRSEKGPRRPDACALQRWPAGGSVQESRRARPAGRRARRRSRAAFVELGGRFSPDALISEGRTTEARASNRARRRSDHRAGSSPSSSRRSCPSGPTGSRSIRRPRHRSTIVRRQRRYGSSSTTVPR